MNTFTAIKNGYLQIIQERIETRQIHNTYKFDGADALQLAIIFDQVEVVKILINAGANMEVTISSEASERFNIPHMASLIYLSLHLEKIEITQIILHNKNTQYSKSSITYRNSDYDAFELALENNYQNLLLLFVEKGIVPNYLSSNWDRPKRNDILLLLFTQNNYEVVRKLIDYQFLSVDYIFLDNDTLLYKAVVNNQTELVKTIISAGYNILDEFPNILRQSVFNGNSEMIDFLAQVRIMTVKTIKETAKNNILKYLSHERWSDIQNTANQIQLLDKYKFESDLLFEAIEIGNAYIIISLLHNNIFDSNDLYLIEEKLLNSILQGNYPIIEVFTALSIFDLDKVLADGETLFYKAIKDKNTELLELLLATGKTFKYTYDEERPQIEEGIVVEKNILMDILENGDIDILKLLVQHGLDVNIYPKQTIANLESSASRYGGVHYPNWSKVYEINQVIEEISEYRLVVKAIKQCNAEVVKLLIENDADINILLPKYEYRISNQNNFIPIKISYESLLGMSIDLGYFEISTMLIEAGANITPKLSQSHTNTSDSSNTNYAYNNLLIRASLEDHKALVSSMLGQDLDKKIIEEALLFEDISLEMKEFIGDNSEISFEA